MKPTPKMVKLGFWGIIPLLVLALAGQGNAQQYQYNDLGTLDGNESEAHGINARGWVVGMAQTASGASHAFLKKPDEQKMEDLDTLGGAFSSANGINAGGWVVGESTTTSGASHAFLKNPNEQKMEDLDTLGGSYCYAYGINDSNWVVGQSQTDLGDWHAFLKRGLTDGMEDLFTRGGASSCAFAINAGGSVVGVSDISPETIFSHAFLKNPNEQQMHDLDTLGGNFSSAYGINAGGWVVGESEIAPDGNWHAFLRRGPTADMEDLGTLGGADSCAFGINAGGSVVGVTDTTSGKRAFLKNPGVAMQDLNNLLQLPAGVVLVRAVAINDSGWIVGNALNTATQHLHAFLLIANSNNVKPVANAGPNQSVALGDMVNLNGTGSYDVNGDPLTYKWSFDTVPAGSGLAQTVLTSATPYFQPDTWGQYVMRLVVNDGFLDSDPSNVSIQVTVTRHSAIVALQNLQSQISGLKPMMFKNANNQNALLNKLNAVIGNIDAGNYVDALNQLQQDVLGKVTGKNSWITNPTVQAQLYNSLTTIISELKAL